MKTRVYESGFSMDLGDMSGLHYPKITYLVLDGEVTILLATVEVEDGDLKQTWNVTSALRDSEFWLDDARQNYRQKELA